MLSWAIYNKNVVAEKLLLKNGAKQEELKSTDVSVPLIKSDLPEDLQKFLLALSNPINARPIDPEELLDALISHTKTQGRLDTQVIRFVMDSFTAVPLLFESLKIGMILVLKQHIDATQKHWRWMVACEIINNALTIPHQMPASSETLVQLTLRNCDWEIAATLIKRNSPIPSQVSELPEPQTCSSGLFASKSKEKLSPLVWILKHTKTADYHNELSATHQNPIACIKLLLAAGANANEHFYHDDKLTSPLGWALYQNNVILVRILLNHGVYPEAQPGQPLHYASAKCSRDIVIELIVTGHAQIDKEIRGLSAIETAITSNRLDVVAVLLKYKATIRNPDSLSVYINNCDAREHDVLLSQSRLVQQQTKFFRLADHKPMSELEEADVKSYKRKLKRLRQLKTIHKAEVINAIEALEQTIHCPMKSARFDCRL